jgi:hypothetical protein
MNINNKVGAYRLATELLHLDNASKDTKQNMNKNRCSD